MLLKINWTPKPKQLRTFGAIGVVVLTSLALAVYRRHRFMGVSISVERATTIAYALWAVAGLAAVLAFVYPRALRPAYLLLSVITLPIGFVVSTVMMVATYFLVVTPIGFLLRRGGWDPMARRFDRDGATYWTPRRRTTDVKSYFRQY